MPSRTPDYRGARSRVDSDPTSLSPDSKRAGGSRRTGWPRPTTREHVQSPLIAFLRVSSNDFAGAARASTHGTFTQSRSRAPTGDGLGVRVRGCSAPHAHCKS